MIISLFDMGWNYIQRISGRHYFLTNPFPYLKAKIEKK
jgi:hypothetical protein